MTSPLDPQPHFTTHINGPSTALLDRLAISELCKGWPVYRDASEWKNYRSLFLPDAYVWTTWSKRLHIDDFILASKRGKENGDFIMHRECGTLVDLAQDKGRAVGKMKATITQRFVDRGGDDGYGQGTMAGTSSPINNSATRQHRHRRNISGVSVSSTSALSSSDGDSPLSSSCSPAATPADGEGGTTLAPQRQQQEQRNATTPIEYDVDCDCQFHFFCIRLPQTGEWKIKYVKLIYSKDKLVPIDGQRVPHFSAKELAPYPMGYKYLGAAQARLGHDMDLYLPTPGDKGRWLDLYVKMGEWLDGKEDVDLIGGPKEEDEDGAEVEEAQKDECARGKKHAGAEMLEGKTYEGVASGEWTCLWED